MRGQTAGSEASMPSTTCEHDDTTLRRAALHLLPDAERARLAERLESCGECRARLAEYEALVTGLQGFMRAEGETPIPADAEADRFAAHTVLPGRWRERGVERDAGEHVQDAGIARRHAAPGQRANRAWRAAAVMGPLAAVLLLALLLSSFWAFGPGRGANGTPTPSAETKPALPVVDRALGVAPLACAGAPAPRASVDGIGGAVGAAPFWVGGLVGSHATLLAGGTSPAPYGWYGKIVTALDGTLSSPVTMRGVNLRNNTPLWFQVGGATTTTPTFRRSVGTTDAGYIFVPTAGCYTLTVTWSTGSWTYTFGAGNSLPASVGAMPATCANQPAVAPLASGLPEVFGQFPLWLTAAGPRASYRLDLSGDGVPATFFVSNSLTSQVTIRGKSLANGSPVGFVASPNPAATVLVLNNHYSRSGGQYTPWQARAFFPAAGCYAVTATWPGGSWTFDVAAGA